jgi:hypothetical protein
MINKTSCQKEIEFKFKSKISKIYPSLNKIS